MKARHKPARKATARRSIDVAAFDPQTPSPVRIVDQALAVQGWSRTARYRILQAIKSGAGDRPLPELTAKATERIADGTHASRCQSSDIEPNSLGPSALLRAADPIDK